MFEQCLESIFTQHTEYKIEVVVGKQGDDDLSYFEQHYPIRVVDCGSPSLFRARVALYKAALGKYVWYVDCDDYIKADSVSALLDFANEQGNPDIIVFGLERCNQKGQPIPKSEWLPLSGLTESKCLTSQEALEALFHWDIENYTVIKLIKTDLTIDFPDLDVFTWEDLVFSPAFLSSSNSVVTFPKVLYVYRFNQHSGLHTFKKKNIDDMLAVFEYRLRFKRLKNYVYCLQRFACSVPRSIAKGAALKELKKENLDKIVSKPEFGLLVKEYIANKTAVKHLSNFKQKICLYLFWLLRKKYFALFIFVSKCLYHFVH